MSEFRNKVLKKYGKKECKINNSYGNKLAWRWLKKNKFFDIEPISENMFGKIIKGIHNIYKERLLQGHIIKFPDRMGKIELIKNKNVVTFKGDKLVINKPVDWNKTLQLWEEDEEAYKDKVVIRREDNTYYKIVYNKNNAVYNNKSYIRFAPSRSLKRAVKEKINNKELDACYEIY